MQVSNFEAKSLAPRSIDHFNWSEFLGQMTCKTEDSSLVFLLISGSGSNLYVLHMGCNFN